MYVLLLHWTKGSRSESIPCRQGLPGRYVGGIICTLANWLERPASALCEGERGMIVTCSHKVDRASWRVRQGLSTIQKIPRHAVAVCQITTHHSVIEQ